MLTELTEIASEAATGRDYTPSYETLLAPVELARVLSCWTHRGVNSTASDVDAFLRGFFEEGALTESSLLWEVTD
ncbi:MAG: hypothetical protein WBP49_06800 [Acidimicrobiia bacterium]